MNLVIGTKSLTFVFISDVIILFSQVEHPFEAEREYQRALNSVKLEKVFAKPFIGSLDGHRDGITCVTKHPGALSTIASAASDGEIRLWQLANR